MQGFEFMIPIVLFVCITLAIKFVVDSRVRKRMVENNVSEDMVKSILAADERTRRLSALKWGLVLTSVGFAFGLVDLMHLSFDEGHTGALGLVIAAAGAGMLVYHFIADRVR